MGAHEASERARNAVMAGVAGSKTRSKRKTVPGSLWAGLIISSILCRLRREQAERHPRIGMKCESARSGFGLTRTNPEAVSAATDSRELNSKRDFGLSSNR
jgi:hypothetical protein